MSERKSVTREDIALALEVFRSNGRPIGATTEAEYQRLAVAAMWDALPATPPASETGDAWDIVKELHAEDCPKRTVGWCNCGVQGPLNRFYAAIRAAALDEARAAVEACNIAIVWYNDRTPLAAIDALRRTKG